MSTIKTDNIVNRTGDQDSGLDLSTNDVVKVKVAGSEKMRVHSDGKLYVQKASSGATPTAGSVAVFEDDANTEISVLGGSSSIVALNFGDSVDPDGGGIRYNNTSGSRLMQFYIEGGNRLQVNGEGVTAINASQAAYGLQVTNDGDQTDRMGIQITCGKDNASGTNYLMGFRDGDGNSVGSITFSGSNASFNTSSDYRLKSNVSDLADATTKLKELKPKKFSWTRDTTNTLIHGFLAHEVSPVVPEAVIGEKDAKDADGNPEYQQLDHSKLVPLLVKTIQELEARITALEAK